MHYLENVFEFVTSLTMLELQVYLTGFEKKASIFQKLTRNIS